MSLRTPRISKDTIAIVKERANSYIVEEIERHVPLKKAGKDHVGLCPFHEERSPSFSVSPSKRIYKCFGCGASGDTLKFLMEYGGHSFTDVVLELAGRYGIPVDEPTRTLNYPAPRQAEPKPESPAGGKVKFEKPLTYVQEKGDRLLGASRDADLIYRWLREKRGYSLGLIQKLATEGLGDIRLGLEYTKAGDKFFPSVGLYLKTADGTYQLKKRPAPYLQESDRPSDLKRWMQYGVTARIVFAYRPEDATATLLCEGEWDAIFLGFLVSLTDLKLAVACSTSGAGTVPPPEELSKIPGQIITYFDRDEAGEKGASKWLKTLGRDRVENRLVPVLSSDCPKGWDITDALKAGFTLEDLLAAPACPEQESQSYPREASDDEPESEPDQNEYAQYQAWENEQEENAEAEAEEKTRQWKAAYEERVAREQQKLCSLTYKVDIELNERYIPINEVLPRIPLRGITNLKAPKGCGKSTLVKTAIPLWLGMGYQICSITPRIALGRGQAREWDIRWIKDSGRGNSTIGLCWDSLFKIVRGRSWAKTVIIIDEAELGFMHVIRSDTCSKKRADILLGFFDMVQECLSNGGLIVLADADLTDIPCDYIKAIAPEAPVFTIVNKHMGPSWDVDFYSGERDEVIDSIIDALEKGQKIALAVDNQREAEAIDRKITQVFGTKKKIIRIDKTTTEQDWGKSFVKDVNKGIRTFEPDLLIYTPSMGAGVSIEEDWFDFVYGLYYTVIEPSQFRQMLARVRFPVKRVIWVREPMSKTSDNSLFIPKEILARMMKYHEETTFLLGLANRLSTSNNPEDGELLEVFQKLWNPASQEWNSPHIQLFAKIKARSNYALSQADVQLMIELEEEGHDVYNHEGEKTGTGRQVNDIKEDLKQEEAIAISRAEEISLDQARFISSNASATQEDRHAAAKAFLKDALPGLDLTPDLIYKIKVDDRGRWLNAIYLEWAARNPKKTKERDTRTWLHHLKEPFVFLPDIKTLSLQAEVLIKLDTLALLVHGQEYSSEHPAIKKFAQKAYRNRDKLKTALGVLVSKKSEPIRVFERVMERLGLEIKMTRRTQEDGKRVRYFIVEGLDDQDRINILAARDLKYKDLEKPQSVPVENEQKTAESAGAETTQNRSEKSGLDSTFYFNSKGTVEATPQSQLQHSFEGIFETQIFSGQNISNFAQNSEAKNLVNNEGVILNNESGAEEGEEVRTECICSVNNGAIDHGFELPSRYKRLVSRVENCWDEEEFVEVAIASNPDLSPLPRMEALEEALMFCHQQAKYQANCWLDAHRHKIKQAWAREGTEDTTSIKIEAQTMPQETDLLVNVLAACKTIAEFVGVAEMVGDAIALEAAISQIDKTQQFHLRRWWKIREFEIEDLMAGKG